MKHLLIAVGAFAMLALAACGGGSTATISNEKPGFDTLFSAAQADSFMTCIATIEGLTNNSRFDMALEREPGLSKDKFVEGFKYALFADTVTSFQYGMQTGSLMASHLAEMEKRGIKIDRKAFFNTFYECFTADSVDSNELTRAQETMSYFNRKFNEAMRAYERAQLENSEEAINNAAAGAHFIDSIAAADKDVIINENGVGIKVLNPGADDKVKPSDMVLLHYEAATSDGRVFDRADANNARPVSVATRVNGLQQALALLGKGGKAVVYIPGKEAYGVDSNRRYRLAPNQAIVYTVEVINILPPETAR